jgi:hypothetical protein
MTPILPSLRFGVAGLLLLGSWGVSALAANDPPPARAKTTAKAAITKVSPKTELAAALIQSYKRAPIPYKAWEMRHPQDGKACKPGDMLTLPNGKQVTAKDYYDQLNRLEKQFNAVGHTLRQPADKVLLQESKFDKALLATQARNVTGKHRPFNPKTMRRPTALKDLPAAYQAAVKKASSQQKGPAAPAGGAKPKGVGLDLPAAPQVLRVATAEGGNANTREDPAMPPGELLAAAEGGNANTREDPAMPPGELLAAAEGGNANGDHEHQTFDFHPGDDKIASVFLNGQWDLNISPAAVDLNGEAHAGAFLVNQRIEMLGATVAVHGGAGAGGSAKFTVSVLGKVVHNLNEPFKGTFQKGDQVSQTVEHSVPFTFFLGPIPISIKVGARGGVGVGYFLGVNTQPLLATAQVIPNAQVDAFAQAGIDIKIASVGVKGELQLLRFSVTLGAEAGVQGSDLHLFVHGENNLTLLAGKLSFVAEVFVPAFKLPPFEKKSFEHKFFEFAGINVKLGSLFNVDRHKPLAKAAARAPAPAPVEALAQATPKASLLSP